MSGTKRSGPGRPPQPHKLLEFRIPQYVWDAIAAIRRETESVHQAAKRLLTDWAVSHKSGGEKNIVPTSAEPSRKKPQSKAVRKKSTGKHV